MLRKAWFKGFSQVVFSDFRRRGIVCERSMLQVKTVAFVGQGGIGLA
ncbi:MAG: hypothetical protein JWQ49_428 [Edaphobacter sp.]|nr:hypothetical protein [Edaphobacter sp.]